MNMVASPSPWGEVGAALTSFDGFMLGVAFNIATLVSLRGLSFEGTSLHQKHIAMVEASEVRCHWRTDIPPWTGGSHHTHRRCPKVMDIESPVESSWSGAQAGSFRYAPDQLDSAGLSKSVA